MKREYIWSATQLRTIGFHYLGLLNTGLIATVTIDPPEAGHELR